MSTPDWMPLGSPQDAARCGEKAGPRGRVRCEMPEGHTGVAAGAIFHCGRGPGGRWKSWQINEGDASGVILCTECWTVKPLSGFAARGDGTDKRRSKCIQCDQGRQKRHRTDNSEYHHQRCRDWREANLEHAREYGRAWHMTNREQHNEARRRHSEANRPQELGRHRSRREALRAEVFGHYGEACACCGSTNRLTIDHVNGDGGAHRRELFSTPRGQAGVPFYSWLVKNGFPSGFQTLCCRCNTSKGTGERCRLDHAAVVIERAS